MREQILRLARDDDARARLAENGLATIRARHTCPHRAEQLEAIHEAVAAITRRASKPPYVIVALARSGAGRS